MKSTFSSSRQVVRALCALAALVPLASAAAVPRFQVKVADHEGSILIPGDSVEAGHAGWIDAHAFGQGLNRPAGETFVGTTSFTFHKSLDSASPRLQDAAIRGTTLPSVIIHYLGDDDADRGFAPLRVELNHVMVTGYRVGGGSFNPLGPSADERPMEEITLIWSQVVLHYRDEVAAGESTEGGRGEFTAYAATENPLFDDDQDGIPNHEDSDDDNDGIPDQYEIENGLNPFVDDVQGDADGDKRSNFDEAVAGTRANDGSDFFRIDSLVYRITPEGPEAVVTLTVKPGRQYKLLASADLKQPRESWFVVDQFEVPADEEGSAVEIVLNGPLVANAGRMFFAAEVDLAPVAAP